MLLTCDSGRSSEANNSPTPRLRNYWSASDCPGFAARDVVNLSGGEQQRVSLARALANRPEVLLLDEPTSALDEAAKSGIEELICKLVRETSVTCVLVTHDRNQARRMCHRVAILEKGRLIQTGIPAEVLRA